VPKAGGPVRRPIFLLASESGSTSGSRCSRQKTFREEGDVAMEHVAFGLSPAQVVELFDQTKAEVQAVLNSHENRLKRLLGHALHAGARKGRHVSSEGASRPATATDADLDSQARALTTPNAELKSFTAEMGIGIVNNEAGAAQDEWRKALMPNGGGFNFTGNLSLTIPRMRQPVAEDSKLRQASKSGCYSLTRALVVVLDAVLVVTVLQKAATSIESSKTQLTVDAFDVWMVVISHFTFGFMLFDLIFHIILDLPHVDLLLGRTGYRWFNLVVLCQHGTDIVSSHISGLQSYSTEFRRVVAQFAVLRVIRFFLFLPEVGGKSFQNKLGELRIMIRVLASAIQPLLWCTLLITMILTIFGVFFAETTVGFLLAKGRAWDPDLEELRESWGTVTKSMFSLYQIMFGGKEWAGLYDAMSVMDMRCRIGLLAFVCFTYVALLNTVTAVFVQVAFLRTENDRERLVEKELDDKRDFLQTMRRMFSELDHDGSGIIHFEELHEHLNHPEIGAYFSKLGVDCSEVEKLFHLLDEDGNKSIDRDEFMYGCLRLRGAAKSLDVALLHSEIRFAIKCVRDLDRSMKRRFHLLNHHDETVPPGSRWRKELNS